jgi:hypothetical protein
MIVAVNKNVEANEANVINKIVAANKAILIDRANLDNETILDNEANGASLAEANKLLANNSIAKELLANISIAIVLYSLTKHCEVFAKDKGYFEMTIFNN